MHNEWVRETVLMQIARRKLLNFKKREAEQPCNYVEAEWTVPERLVARRPCPSAPGWEVLVKWRKLGYESCTWEVGCLGGQEAGRGWLLSWARLGWLAGWLLRLLHNGSYGAVHYRRLAPGAAAACSLAHSSRLWPAA
jgi:hypothetical protein